MFEDRREAGRELGKILAVKLAGEPVIVLALPRGGVPVGFEVARILGAPLDVFVVRKLGVPGHEELAMGAIASGGVRVMNDDVCDVIRCPPAIIDAVAAREGIELARREQAYRGARPPIDVRDKTAVLVDDGIATGASIRAAVKAVRALGAKRVVVATPIAPMETCRDLRVEADEVFCVRTPEPFGAVGRWYRDFDETSDEEVRSLLGLGELAVSS